jgi:hypothetical protein
MSKEEKTPQEGTWIEIHTEKEEKIKGIVLKGKYLVCPAAYEKGETNEIDKIAGIAGVLEGVELGLFLNATFVHVGDTVIVAWPSSKKDGVIEIWVTRVEEHLHAERIKPQPVWKPEEEVEKG